MAVFGVAATQFPAASHRKAPFGAAFRLQFRHFGLFLFLSLWLHLLNIIKDGGHERSIWAVGHALSRAASARGQFVARVAYNCKWRNGLRSKTRVFRSRFSANTDGHQKQPPDIRRVKAKNASLICSSFPATRRNFTLNASKDFSTATIHHSGAIAVRPRYRVPQDNSLRYKNLMYRLFEMSRSRRVVKFDIIVPTAAYNIDAYHANACAS